MSTDLVIDLINNVKLYQNNKEIGLINKAIDFVRIKQKPFVQIVNTYRLNAHSKGDDDRSIDEIEKYWEKEPLQYLETKISKEYIKQTKLSVEKRLQTIEKRVNDMEFGSIN